MESETKQSVYHSATYHAAGEAIVSFKPINEIHQHLCAFHVYSYVNLRLSPVRSFTPDLQVGPLPSC